MTREEEIKEQAQGRIFLSCNFDQNLIGMAEWADETMIEKACEWLEEKLPIYWSQVNANDTEEFIDEFKKAMGEKR